MISNETVDNLAATRRRPRGTSLQRERRLWGWIFLSPWVIGFVVFKYGLDEVMSSQPQLPFPGGKTARRLGRRGVVFAASRKSRPLQQLLEGNARKRVGAKILRPHPGHQRGVGVGAAAGVQAHAVGHHAARLRRRGHHRAARAHAKGIHPPPARAGGQLILPRRQGRVPGGLVVQAGIYVALQVLNTHPNGERLCFQYHPGVGRLAEGIPRRVPAGQHQHPTGQRPVGGLNAHQPPAGRLQAGKRGAKPHLPAQGA